MRQAALTDLPEPTWRMLLGRGLPKFALEGFVPVARLLRRLAESAASAPASPPRRRWPAWSCSVSCGAASTSRSPASTCVFIVIQALVALAAHSATVYLAQPVVLSACWGIAYLVSAAIGGR